MDKSKNRLFLASLILIGLGFLVGVYLSFTEYSAHGQSVAELKKARDASARLLGGSSVADVTEPVALKQGGELGVGFEAGGFHGQPRSAIRVR
jgi:hypothetical protein